VKGAADSAPRVTHLLETALYVDDIPKSVDFYQSVFGFETLGPVTPRLAALDVGGRDVLLIFQRGGTADGVDTGNGMIPPHDGSGPSHFAFAIEKEDVERWARHLESLGVPIESRVTWERGGMSIYFRDPDGHSVEVVTPGTWATY
jgi:catechol 2,3-dioxygenase-like lactoylglutathione lyase family enzyme